MEKELNIAAILKEKPKGTKLWSPISGDCKYEYLIHDSINVWFQGLGVIMLSKKGKWNPCGETIIFPSKQMQDWSKFAWKKGDVLVSNDYSTEVIFYDWYDDTYTNFYCRHYLNSEDENNIKYSNAFLCTTGRYSLEDKNATQTYINTIEERFGGKLNLETLEIEHTEPKQEFKDGDIVHIPEEGFIDEAIFIAKVETKGVLYSYVYMSKDSMIPLANSSFSVSGCLDSLRLATDSEKQELFSALEKKNKRWNPDTKQIEDLPKKCEFKPMDWCLMKDSTKYWELCQFAYTKKVHGTTIYSAVGGLIYHKCIPYNDQTKHLLGTTDEWKGGEG